MVNIHSKATKLTRYGARSAIALLSAIIALNAPIQANAGGIADGALTVPNCKWVTLTRTIKAPYTVPPQVADLMPRNLTGCIVWLNRAISGNGYKVDFFAGKDRTITLEAWKELDDDGTWNEYYKVQ